MQIQNKTIRAQLAKLAPSIAFSIDYEHDPSFHWDGDGPDPRHEGFEPFNVDVVAKVIANGQIYEGRNYLGGCYEKPGEWDEDIGGYLPQMLDEALGDLVRDFRSVLHPNIIKQANAALKYLKSYMHRTSMAQRRGR